MNILEYDKDFIYFKGTSHDGYNTGATYVKSKNAWRLPITKSAILDLQTRVTPPEFNKLSKLLSDLKKYKDEVVSVKDKEDTAGDERLRPYQRVDVEFIKKRKNTAIFNEQRTGKTPTILLAVEELLGKLIVVCPSGLKINWKNEYETWLGKQNGIVVSGTPKNRNDIYKKFKKGDYKALFLSYETLRQDIKKLEGLHHDVLIVDESHRLRNFKTQQSKAVYRLSKTAQHVYPMTGTPAVNHPSDVYGILRLLRPSKYTSYWQFIDRYFGYTETRFGRQLLDLKNDKKEEFHELLNSISIQRKRKDVMQWVPKVTTRTISLEPDKKQLKQYDTILKEFRYNDNIIPNVIAQLTRLRQVCLDPGLLDLDGNSPKTQFILEYLEDNDGKVIVFSSFTSYLKRLHEKIPNSVLLTGEQTVEEKQAAVDAIQKGDVKVLLANIIAGGTGWTLDKADTIIFSDKSFNPIDNDQAKDRFIPTDPNKEYGAKQIIDLIIENTIEKKVNQLLLRKYNIIKYVNNYGLNAIVSQDEIENNIGDENELLNSK